MKHEARKSFQRKHRSAENTDLFSVLLKNAALGTGISLLCAVAMMLLGSLICSRSKDPLSMIVPMGLVILYLSSLVGGIVTVRRHGEKALLCGALCGLFLLILFWLTSLFFQGDGAFSFFPTFLFRLLTVVFSILGAFLGQKRATHRPRRKH